MFTTPTIREVTTSAPDVYAFRISGQVSKDDMHRMAERMNAAFDTHGKVSMLLIFEGYEGSETGAGLDWSAMKSQFRALSKVDRYAVVGAPASARSMIETMDAIIPVDAKTFDAAELEAAWTFVGARPA